MPWTTPSLDDVRKQNRDYITARLHSAAMIPNSVLRVFADAAAGLAYLVLLYIDWLARQLLPDTAETEWLDRHGDIWLVNSDGTIGRKSATLASGTVTATGLSGMILPAATQLVYGTGGITYETLEEIVIGAGDTPVNVRAIDPGAAGNLEAGTTLAFVTALAGVDGTATVVGLSGGSDTETDDELRERVLRRIQQPPMGGSESDYEQWALAVPGVTRAWAASEMGIGTVTVRFMMDDLRADNDGFPYAEDIEAVTAYIDTKRPIAVKDFFVVGPIPQRIDVGIANLVLDNEAVRAGIEVSLDAMLLQKAAPGQTIYASWKSYAIMSTADVSSFDLTNNVDDVMESPGHMAVLGDIYYGAD